MSSGDSKGKFLGFPGKISLCLRGLCFQQILPMVAEYSVVLLIPPPPKG